MNVLDLMASVSEGGVEVVAVVADGHAELVRCAFENPRNAEEQTTYLFSDRRSEGIEHVKDLSDGGVERRVSRM